MTEEKSLTGWAADVGKQLAEKDKYRILLGMTRDKLRDGMSRRDQAIHADLIDLLMKED